MRNFQKAVIALSVLASQSAFAYTVAQPSPTAPPGLEAEFIAATTTQFNATVVANPFFPGTYSITLNGLNPNYNPPLTSTQLLQQIDLDAQYMADVDSYTYVDGWADGESYNQYQNAGIAQYFEVNCSTPSFFNLVQTSTTTFDRSTCQDAMATVSASIYQELLSTPTVVPGDWQ